MQKKRILLVEDDTFLQELYSQILREADYGCIICGDGLKAFEEIKKGGWNLILLDVMLPNMTGFEILEKLHNEKIQVSCPVILMTNMEKDPSDKEKIKLASDVWVKSDMSPPEFLTKIKRYTTI